MKEIWKTIPGYEGAYQISSIGKVKSLKRYIDHPISGKSLLIERILKQNPNGGGYLAVKLSKMGVVKTAQVHKLVVMAFRNHVPNGHNGLVVDHINNIREDNRLENLQLVTNRQNSSKDQKGGTSNYIGVCWNKRAKKWRAAIHINGKSKYLGYFINEIDASQAYQNKLKLWNI